MRKECLLCLLYGCSTVSQPILSIPTWHRWTLQAEDAPLIPVACGKDSFPWVVSLVLRRDPLKGGPEWVSGHRYALAVALEQLPVRMLVLETPWDDTLFFSVDSSLRAVWGQKLLAWLQEELLPFLRAYEVPYIAFGRDWYRAPISSDGWCLLLQSLRVEDSLHQWGMTAGQPEQIPCGEAWDFLGIDYQQFYPPHARSSYHARWEQMKKPIVVLYPNLYEPDKEQAERERKRFWHTPPFAFVAESESDTCFGR
ncbi:MAG: hypothetical protein N2170_05965 [Bacteroidia bacterium]|nr:hypothetical protein [Bacteroidia bacterium]